MCAELDLVLDKKERDNNKVYFETIPEASSLDPIEKNVKTKPLALTENLLEPVESLKSLEKLVPREVKDLVDKHRNRMLGYLAELLEPYNCEAKINSFLVKRNLPHSLESATQGNSISEATWKRVLEIQAKGATTYIINTQNALATSAEKIANKLNELGVLLQTEEQEDEKYRSLFGNKWSRKPSKFVNSDVTYTVQDYGNKLNQAKGIDEQFKQDFESNNLSM